MYAERRTREDRQIASAFANSTPSEPPPVPPTEPPPVHRRTTDGVHTVVSKSFSGAKLETRMGLEPRPYVASEPEPSNPFARLNRRAAVVNALFNRRCAHLLEPELG